MSEEHSLAPASSWGRDAHDRQNGIFSTRPIRAIEAMGVKLKATAKKSKKNRAIRKRKKR